MLTTTKHLLGRNTLDGIFVKSLSKFLFSHHTPNCTPSSAIVRHPAPFFKGKAWWKNEFKDISMDQYKGKWICLFFYPSDFTFVCPTEIVDFNHNSREFEKLNCQIIGCSVDSRFSHREWALKPRDSGGLAPLHIPLLSDITKSISCTYGVLINNPKDPMNGVALRGTFIIDDKGILRHIQINDAGVGRNVNETIRIVKALQFVDKHGEVCPAGWQPGKATINPQDEKNIKDYWQKEHAKH